MRCKHEKYGRYSPQFVAPLVLAPPVRSSPSSLNRSSPGSLLPQSPELRDLVLGPFKRRYTLINVPRRRVNRNIRYTVVIRGRAASPELPLSRICATAANFNARVLARR